MKWLSCDPPDLSPPKGSLQWYIMHFYNLVIKKWNILKGHFNSKWNILKGALMTTAKEIFLRKESQEKMDDDWILIPCIWLVISGLPITDSMQKIRLLGVSSRLHVPILQSKLVPLLLVCSTVASSWHPLHSLICLSDWLQWSYSSTPLLPQLWFHIFSIWVFYC